MIYFYTTPYIHLVSGYNYTDNAQYALTQGYRQGKSRLPLKAWFARIYGSQEKNGTTGVYKCYT